MKQSQVEESPGSVVGDFLLVAGPFWWCFQLFLFDHLGLFSRISFAHCWACGCNRVGAGLGSWRVNLELSMPAAHGQPEEC